MNAIQLATKIAEYKKEIAFALEKLAKYDAMADSAMKVREMAFWGKKLADAQRALQAVQAAAAGGTGAGARAAGHIIPKLFGGIGRAASLGAAQGGAAVATGVGVTVVAGVLVWIAAGVAGKMMADKPIQPVNRPPQNQSPAGLPVPLPGDPLPGSGGGSGNGGVGSLGEGLGPIPETVDRDSFTGVWAKGAGTTAVSRAVLVQTGSDVKGRVEIPEGIYGDGGKILIPRGTYDLTGTVTERKLTFTMDKFSGDVSLNPTGARGMFLSGFMNAPGGRFLGTPVDLQRQVNAAKK